MDPPSRDIDSALRAFERAYEGALREDLGPDPPPMADPYAPHAALGTPNSRNGAQPQREDTIAAQANGRRVGHAASGTSGFTYITLAELLDRPEPAYRFVIDDLLPAAGSSLLVAKPKVGKTILALQAARDVSAGTDFIGRAVRQGPVLYHAFEEKDDEVARTMRRAGSAPEWPIYFHFAEIPRDRIAALRAGIMHYRPTLVVIDTLAYWMQVEDFDDYAQVGRAMRPLHALAREQDCHIMAVHHAGKSKEGIDAALGSTALTANVDTIMVESEVDQGRTLESKQRYGTNLPRTMLAFDEQTSCISIGAGVAAAKRATFEEDILGSVARGNSTERDVREDLHCNRNHLIESMSALQRACLLQRSGEGRRNSPYLYHITAAGQQRLRRASEAACQEQRASGASDGLGICVSVPAPKEEKTDTETSSTPSI